MRSRRSPHSDPVVVWRRIEAGESRGEPPRKEPPLWWRTIRFPLKYGLLTLLVMFVTGVLFYGCGGIG